MVNLTNFNLLALDFLLQQGYNMKKQICYDVNQYTKSQKDKGFTLILADQNT